MIKKYRIICICQIYNEIEKGNLKRFFKFTKPLVDAIVVYDDGSTDGSYEYSMKQTPHVIRGGKNDFTSEIAHKQKLLAMALTLNPDFVLWLDADEVLTSNAEQTLQELCREAEEKELDGISLHEINIWRSNTWKRIDSLFDTGWFVRLWRVTPNIRYNEEAQGLHLQQYPSTLKKISRSEKLAVLHYGFSNEESLSYKYLVYKSHGQRGYDMLDRLISEERLQTIRIPKKLFPIGLYKPDMKPKKLPFLDSLAYVKKYEEKVFRPKYSIICLIYKSTDWLKFVHEQVLRYTDLQDTEFFFIANDASEEVINYLKDNYIPHYTWNNTRKQKKDWYINNVYRAWNFGAKMAKGGFLIFVNSDMGFTPEWLPNLLNKYNGNNCITSRLIESGKLRSGLYGIEKNFGRTVSQFKEGAFQVYAQKTKEEKVENGGLYMPLFIRKSHFLSVGGYPEGNIQKGSDIFYPKIAKEGEPCISGDTVFIEKLKTKGITHQTAFDSIVYHFQCGEMDSQIKKPTNKKNNYIAICNDLVTGTMGEKVLWDFLLDSLPSSFGIDKRIVGSSGNFEEKAKVHMLQNFPSMKMIIQNASFIKTINSKIYTIMFLQDNLRAMGKKSTIQEANLKNGNLLVTNSLQTTLSYPEFDFHIIPIGTNHHLFRPKNKKKLRKKYHLPYSKIGIFVGDFTMIKGWPEVRKCIEKYQEIFWIIVSKTNETYSAANVKVYNRINQELLSDLLNCSDFFILGSKTETQCLSAIEAGLCNIPLLMHNVGIFRDYTSEEKAKIGIFSDNLEDGLKKIYRQKFSPRKMLLKKGLTIDISIKGWRMLLEKVSTTNKQKKIMHEKEMPEETNSILPLIQKKFIRIFG